MNFPYHSEMLHAFLFKSASRNFRLVCNWEKLSLEFGTLQNFRLILFTHVDKSSLFLFWGRSVQQKAGASRAADWRSGRRENSLEQLRPGAWAAVHQPDRGHPHLLGGCSLPGGLYVQLQTGEGCPCASPLLSSLFATPASGWFACCYCCCGGTWGYFFQFCFTLIFG